eukprot:CAMPEP_0170554910 /NCGR_PEP_ID=MMETSP0211-20121228/12787_1 /TAXON_ID=311385 /ORGANISM="Pseudokeronopsis sp., Strain OXSARD2" /LENGTH=204 /DNA_ID=CAMNT_0010864349 /DNA_START=1642 /DNA_END=2256 /DNA_ORIENTATION=+
MRLALSKLEQYEEGVLYEDWTDLVNDRKMGVIIQSRTSPSGGNSIKATGTLDYPAEDIFKVIGNSAYRQIYDKNYDQGHYVMKIGKQAMLIYQKTKKISVVSARDFLLVMIYNKFANGSIKIVVASTDKNELFPEVKGAVRGFVEIGGWMLEPLEEGQTKVTYMTEVDLKGSIPSFVTNTANKDQGYQIPKLKNAITKYKQEIG